GLRGPIGRAFADRLPSGLAWSLGLGVFGLVIAAASGSLTGELAKMSPATIRIFRTVLPNFDLTSAGGFLQLVFVQLGFIVIGFAVGGLVRTSIAAEAVALVVTVTFLVDLVAPPLRLPDWVHQLALTAHMGQPMVGAWDVAGIVACLVLAAGGPALGGWGMRR